MPNFTSPKMLANQWVQKRFGVASSAKFQTHKDAFVDGYMRADSLRNEMLADFKNALIGIASGTGSHAAIAENILDKYNIKHVNSEG